MDSKRKPRRIELEDGEWITVRRPAIADLEAAENEKVSRGHESDLLYSLTLTKRLIVDWSFTGEDGARIAITPESVGEVLTVDDMQSLSEGLMRDDASPKSSEISSTGTSPADSQVNEPEVLQPNG